MEVRAIRRLTAAAVTVFAAALFVTPVLVASAITRSTELPDRLGPSVTVHKISGDPAASLVTAAVSRARIPAAGFDRPAPRSTPSSAPESVQARTTPEAARAQRLLHAMIAAHPILDAGGRWDRATVTIGPTPNGLQGVAYYASGSIVISPTHIAPLEKILAHEVWHVIDYRDNGRIDWGERVPPR